jgi:3-dehydroquinate synthase
MTIIIAGKGSSKYQIHIKGKNFSKAIFNKDIGKNNKVLIITDSGVPKKHIRKIKDIITCKKINVLTLNQGEKSKSFACYQKIMNLLFAMSFDRSDSLIALGGGVVGDITGFCAATYLRGINYIQVPTTLLAQVDSSVGGKTAINVPQGKNLIGSFYNPKFVLISTDFLKTLPQEQYESGLGEVIKYAFIGNKKLKKIIEDNSNKIIERNEKILKTIIEESIKTKSKIVTRDERENGIRAILNFGHTFGHAIEAHHGYKKITHGAAITMGMVIAAKVSLFEGHIKDQQLENIISVIKSLGLKADHTKYKYSDLKKYMKIDKKVSDGQLNLILIDKNFNAFKTSNFNNKNIIKALN